MVHRTTPLPPHVAAPRPVHAPQGAGQTLDVGLTPATLTALQAALSSRDWVAQWIIDPAGDASIVVLAIDDDPLLPGFLLHSRNLIPHVATIADDAWQADQAFASWPEAAAAIVLMAHSARPPRDTGTTRRARGLQAA
jgi:hypothetical protein